MIGQIGGHLHMTSVFLLPLIALVVIRFVEHELDGRNLAIRLGPLIGAPVRLSTENAFSFTLALVAAIVLAFLLVPPPVAGSSPCLPPLAASYATRLPDRGAAPLLRPRPGFHSGSVNEPTPYTTDLLNLVVPTQRVLGGRPRRTSISQHFPSNDSERDGYLGIPVARDFRSVRSATLAHRAAGRLLLAGFVVGISSPASAFGWSVDGHKVVTHAVGARRLSTALRQRSPGAADAVRRAVTAIVVALWMTSSREPGSASCLPALAVLSLIPNPKPARLEDRRIRAAVLPERRTFGAASRPNETMLVLPQAKHGNGMLWQAVSRFPLPPRRRLRRHPTRR